MSSSASRRGGKTTMLQPFPQREVERWRESLQQQPEEVVRLMRAVWSGATSHAQLASLKKLCGEAGKMAAAGSLSPPLLLVLVEMHALCLSRHPLQRAIASLLQSLPEPHPLTITEHVHSAIAAALSGAQQLLAGHSHRLQYLEALGENFPLGEVALWRQLPLVIQYCVSVIESCHRENRLTDPLLTASLKTTMTILHKTQSALCSLLAGTSFFQLHSTHTIDCAVTWPVDLGGQSAEVKGHWVAGLLERAAGVCEHLLKTGGVVPHDLTVTAAMLYVVVVMRTSPEGRGLEAKVTEVVTNWLRETGSPLEAFPRLSLCHALLAKLTPSSLLVETDPEGKSLLLQLFPVTCHLFDSFTETSDRYIASRTLALWTTVARQCAGMVGEGGGVYDALLPSGHVISSVLQYVWTLWEDPVDGIRHQCNIMFENVIGICQQLQNEMKGSSKASTSPFLLSLTGSLLSLSSPTRGKYQLLSTLSHHLPVTTLLLTSPTLPSELLSVMGRQALACHAGELWSRLVQLHWESSETKQLWTETWVDTLVQFMVSASPAALQHTIQHCLPSLFHCCQNCMELIRANLKRITTVTASPDGILTTELACLRCAKSRQKDFIWEKSHETTFTAATHHIDEQMQLSALGLLCESHRTTECPAPSSLPLLLLFLSLNACTQSPNFRYPMITAIKKLLVRIRDSSYAMTKLHKKKRGTDPHATIQSYQEFLQSLLTQQFGSLHPFSSYQRRHTALSVLQLLSSTFPSPSPASPPIQSGNRSAHSADSSTHSFNQSVHRPALFLDNSTPMDSTIRPIFEFPSAVSVQQARRLVYCLRDSYDANRALVIQLLRHLSWEAVSLLESGFLEALTASFCELVSSPRAVDCTTASYLLRLLLRANCTEFNRTLQGLGTFPEPELSSSLSCDPQTSTHLPPPPPPPPAPPPPPPAPHWTTVSLLLSLLRWQLERARSDLLSASVQAPMYGVMQSVRTVLEEVQETGHPLSSDLDVSRAAVAEVIQLCSEVAALASPVVCNSSPEGFLPGAKGLPAVTASSGSAASAGGSPQSLLLCCWHAMKEISLLLGLVIEWAPIGDSPNSLLTDKQVNGIASIFIHQLTEARHRGAFEMAYSGFQKLCQCLWSSSCGSGSTELQLMPSRWVEELLESLQSKSMTRLLSITRRSAGLPFYLQAILTSEPNLTGRPCLKSAMRTLLSVANTCKQPAVLTTPTIPPDPTHQTSDDNIAAITTPDTDSSDAQPQPLSAAVHALNILRALYRDSRLGEHVTPFIPAGVVIAVQGFSATFWPVRNSSTLLFSALVSRIFGAKRVQDEHSVENKMTAREFFTRFPSLHGFLLHELQRAAAELATAGASDGSMAALQPSLFPVLLLLSRLYPTALDEATSPTSLQPFLPLLLQCTSCAVWKTRVLISRALIPLLNPHNAETTLHRMLQQMTTCSQNRLHSVLLALHRLVLERAEMLDGVQCSEGPADLGVWLTESVLARYTLGSKVNPCAVTRCAYLELVTALTAHTVQEKRQQALTSEAALSLASLLQETRETLLGYQRDNGVPLQDEVILNSCKLLFSFASLSVDSAEIGIHVQKLPQISDLLCECLQHESSAAKLYALEYLCDHKELLRQTNGVVRLLVNLAGSECDEDVLAVLYTVLVKGAGGSDEQSLPKESCSDLTTIAMENATKTFQRLELRISLLLFLSALLENSWKTQQVVEWLSLVEPYAHPTAAVELRQAVACGLGRLWRTLLQTESPQSVQTYCVLVVGLLQDGEEEVRDEMAASVGYILAHVSLSVDNLQLSTIHANPSASSALHSFFTALPLIFHHHPLTTLTILLHLVALDTVVADIAGSESSTSSSNTNLLFEEDPLNNYMEEIVVLTAACRGIEIVVATHCKQLHEALVRVTQQICTTAAALQTSVGSEVPALGEVLVSSGVPLSPWERPKVFSGLCRVCLLSEAVVGGSVEAATAAVVGGSVEAATAASCAEQLAVGSQELTSKLKHFAALKTELLLY